MRKHINQSDLEEEYSKPKVWTGYSIMNTSGKIFRGLELTEEAAFALNIKITREGDPDYERLRKELEK